MLRVAQNLGNYQILEAQNTRDPKKKAKYLTTVYTTVSIAPAGACLVALCDTLLPILLLVFGILRPAGRASGPGGWVYKLRVLGFRV